MYKKTDNGDILISSKLLDKIEGNKKLETNYTISSKDINTSEYYFVLKTSNNRMFDSEIFTVTPVEYLWYEDVKNSNAWYYYDIYESTDLGIFVGYSIDDKRYFKPNRSLTRAEALSVILRILDKDSIIHSGHNFTDSKGHWYSDDVSRGIDLGLVVGYPDGSFRGDDFVSRAEISSMLARAFDLSSLNKNNIIGFKDVKSTHWASNHIELLHNYGIVGGFEDRTFRPDEDVTRAQYSKMINLIIKKL